MICSPSRSCQPLLPGMIATSPTSKLANGEGGTQQGQR
jgi:hypothetical protein